MRIVAFFNNRGGVGKTSLVYHLGWTWADAGKRVLMADLDPQSNLTAMCLDEERLEVLWAREDRDRKSIQGAIYPLIEGLGDARNVHLEDVHREELHPRLYLAPGDPRLAGFEARLSDAWPRCLDRDPISFRITSSLYRVIVDAAREIAADLLLIDVGPNLGAINRAALLGAHEIVTPLSADLFSIQALRNLGPTLRTWRDQWSERIPKNPIQDLALPSGEMRPVGYVVMQPALYAGTVTGAHERWLGMMPAEYHESVLAEERPADLSYHNDPCCLGVLRHYRSLMPLAQAARKPIFHLRAADGALGAHATAAREVGAELRTLARRIDQQASPPAVVS